MASSGVTGRGRGAILGRGIEPASTLGRGRGRGIIDDYDSQIPGLRSLDINGVGNGYVDANGYQEDARTALDTVTSKSKNEKEVIAVLTKWLDLACTNEDIGEAVATSACELMPHAEYGDKIRETVLGRIFKLFQECATEKSPTVLSHQLSFMGYMYLIQREPGTNKRFDFYVEPICLFLKEILKHKLTENVVKLLTKQIAINGVALNSTPKGKGELNYILMSIREVLLTESDHKQRPYLLFLCDLQGTAYYPLSDNLLKFYSHHIPRSLLDSYKPLDIDVKLYKMK